MVFDVPSEEQGVDEIVYAIAQPPAESTARLNLGGAWHDLTDADAMLEALDRLGRGVTPTPIRSSPPQRLATASFLSPTTIETFPECRDSRRFCSRPASRTFAIGNAVHAAVASFPRRICTIRDGIMAEGYRQ
jgi:hypothetical protein